LLLLWLPWLAACGPTPWNNPYPPDSGAGNTLFGSFVERPKHLDPARSYSVNESVFTGAIYEPALQYHYLRRPYTLIPQTAVALPEVRRVDADGKPVADDAPPERVARTIYTLHLQPGIQYQPHPALARAEDGRLVYAGLQADDLDGVRTLADFQHTGSRELVAADYVYQVKRLAHPALHSPILGLMSEYIVGLRDYAADLEDRWQALGADADEGAYLDLESLPLAGVEVIDRYTWRIILKGSYPQFRYWLAMPFFAPVPPEAEHFYAQPGMRERNLSLDWYPIGTGPYMMVENNPNRRIVLQRNPLFHGERYPGDGEPDDAAAGLLADADKPMPFIDRLVFTLEPETIPRWNKFLQGFYDTAGVSSDAFDQAVSFSPTGETGLTPSMRERGIKLLTSVDTTTFYSGFNMLDPVVGGLQPNKAKLRQAIAMAVDQEEFTSIFLNGQGIEAQGPIPPGIFGYMEGEQGINPLVYRWQDGRPQRRPLSDALQLLAEAGYPGGRDPNTGRPLLLYLDISATGPDDKARLNWYRKQFNKLGIQLVIRNTDYNRFIDKMRKGNAQLFFWGWSADYPDPENFMFLLYGPNGKVEHGGENAANYRNPLFDRLFRRMKHLPDGPVRRTIIRKMLAIAREDSPWLWGFHRVSFSLEQAWVYNSKPNSMANNTFKYLRLDPALRERSIEQWNRPVVWPLVVVGLGLLGLLLSALLAYYRRR
jgi:ABC-type transport system substrate-binding protein